LKEETETVTKVLMAWVYRYKCTTIEVKCTYIRTGLIVGKPYVTRTEEVHYYRWAKLKYLF